MNQIIRGWRLLPLAIAATLLAGCASTAMKGTPFYTGEYPVRQGPAEDRVNLWPLVYYRAPALAVLWPIGEKTDDHVAIRPLFSVYGLDRNQAVVKVLWPLSSIDTHAHEGYVFPFFWGTNRFAVFPLYWHSGDPYGAAGGYDALIPLWSHRRTADGDFRTHVLWPFLNAEHMPGSRGWRIWPLYGSYAHGADRTRFYAWPLGWQWHGPGDTGHALLPLYGTGRDGNGRHFYSLPFSRGEDSDGGAWQLAIPLWYARHDVDSRRFLTLLGGAWRDETDSGWLAVPLLSGGSHRADGGSFWIAGPLAHAAWSATERREHVFPLYYRARTESGRSFISLPWSQVARRDATGWQLAPPLYYRVWNTNGSALVTPLYARGTAPDGQKTWQGIFPLLYSRAAREGRLIATPLGGYSRSGARTAWVAVPALAAGSRTPDSSDLWAAAGLIHAERDATGARQQHVLPLYYWNGASGTFLSLPVVRTRGDQRTRTIVPPALSWVTQRPQRRDLWIVGPLAHFSSGPDHGSSHLFPLYYATRDRDAIISPLYARFGEDVDRTVVVPPLLSAYTRAGDERELYALLGIFRQRWGRDVPNDGQFLPFYMYKANQSLWTPIYGRQQGDNGFVYPLTPLAGVYTGARRGGWVFPFWSRQREIDTGRVTGTLLWGDYKHIDAERSAALFPFYRYRAHAPIPKLPSLTTGGPTSVSAGITADRSPSKAPALNYGSTLSVLGLYRRADLLVAPQPDANAGRTRTHERTLFPLWSHKLKADLDRGAQTATGSFGLCLYDYRHENYPTKDGQTSDYRRARILWRLWHYERSDDAVSIDVFPSITYDRRPDGYRKVSFLWRAFRYEATPQGRNLDLLFIPLLRQHSASG